jgi:hypothetical protein
MVSRHVGDGAARKTKQAGIDISHRQTGGEIREKAVECVAEPSPHGRKPVVARVAAWRTEDGRGPANARPVDIAFSSEDDPIDLPIVADGPADEATRDLIYQHYPPGAAPTAAAIDAQIETRPVMTAA